MKGMFNMEYVIKVIYDNESGVWIATNDDIPIALESESLDQLMKRVKISIPELLELNNLPKAKYIRFLAEVREEVIA